MVNQLLSDPKITQKQKAVLYAENAFKRYTQTELDTVLRAHSARDWEQFQAEKDVLPNLEWVPSTSANAGEDHRVFWGVTLPVDDEFWQRHRPGDRWNCKCRLRATDKPASRRPKEDATVVPPAVGLEENPAKTSAIFSQKTPYFARATASDDYEVFAAMRKKFQAENKSKGSVLASTGEKIIYEAHSAKEVSRQKRNLDAYFLKLEIFKNIGKYFSKLKFITEEEVDLEHNNPRQKSFKLKVNFVKFVVYELEMFGFSFKVEFGKYSNGDLFLYYIGEKNKD